MLKSEARTAVGCEILRDGSVARGGGRAPGGEAVTQEALAFETKERGNNI
jgi:hypothetical protein